MGIIGKANELLLEALKKRYRVAEGKQCIYCLANGKKYEVCLLKRDFKINCNGGYVVQLTVNKADPEPFFIRKYNAIDKKYATEVNVKNPHETVFSYAREFDKAIPNEELPNEIAKVTLVELLKFFD